MNVFNILNIIYLSQKPRKSSSLPLKSSSRLFSLDASPFTSSDARSHDLEENLFNIFNIIYSSQKPRIQSSLPLKSSSRLFSLNASLSLYKMSSSLLSSALLMPQRLYSSLTFNSLPGIFHPLANIRYRRPLHSSCRCNMMSWCLSPLCPFVMHKFLEWFIN